MIVCVMMQHVFIYSICTGPTGQVGAFAVSWKNLSLVKKLGYRVELTVLIALVYDANVYSVSVHMCM